MTTKQGLKFSVAAIDSAKEILKALPPAPRETKEVSLREAIEELAPTIRGLLGKGYSRQQIVDLIQEQGVACSLTSLKTYFRRSPGKTKAKTSAGPTAASQETSPATSQPVVSGGSGDPKREARRRRGREHRRILSRRAAEQSAAKPAWDWRPAVQQPERQRRRLNRQQNVQSAAAGRESAAGAFT